MSDIIEPVGWLYPDGTYTPHRGENLEQWGWSPVYAAATIERLTRERDNYQARVIPAETGIVRAEAQMMDVVERMGDDIVTLRAELAKAREALEALEDAYRAVEIAMPPEQGKAAVLAWMKARAALAPAKPCPICHGSGYDERTRKTLHKPRCPNGCPAAPEGK